MAKTWSTPGLGSITGSSHPTPLTKPTYSLGSWRKIA
jgi:hypothetical protein